MLWCQVVPNVEVDGRRQSGTRLVETSCVVDFCNFLEAGAFVAHWDQPTPDRPERPKTGLIQFAARDVLNRCAQFTQNFAAQTRHTEFQTVEVARRVDLVAEPTTGLRTGVTCQQDL